MVDLLSWQDVNDGGHVVARAYGDRGCEYQVVCYDNEFGVERHGSGPPWFSVHAVNSIEDAKALAQDNHDRRNGRYVPRRRAEPE
jgi:hypothetical protein